MVLSIHGYSYTINTKEPLTPSISVKRLLKKYKSGDGYKSISKSLSIHQSSVKINKKWKEYGKHVKIPRAGLQHKLSECVRRRLVRETNKTPLTTLKELNA